MIRITDKENCCGCTACASICGHNAISMQPDSMGFLYPVVDLSRCIECGLCEKVCSFNDVYDYSNNLPKSDSYAVRHRNKSEVSSSRSGGAFIAVSDWILEHGGVVYGAGFGENFEIIHKRATTKEERDQFKGSKYVQSNLKDTFRKVKQDLRNGGLVMFSGTPCQTAGLKSYIGKKLIQKLYLVDIVCHGVPGPNIWRDYLSYLEKKEHDELCKVNFRDKRFGWSAHKETYQFLHKGYKTFQYSFYQPVMFRKSCGKCHFCNLKRPSDITLADFWGSDLLGLNKDNKGLSLLLINSIKGLELFENVKSKVFSLPVVLENSLQPNLVHPLKEHPMSNQFEQDYINKGIGYIIKKYCENTLYHRIISKIKRIL